jgi:IS5 family transposase
MFKGLFDTQSRFAKIDRNGDPLKKINELVDWRIFVSDLAPLQEVPNKSKRGRRPIDVLLKFKMLILQSLYNLSDDGLEQQVLDRLSFMRFLGLGMGDTVPDSKTIWLFREKLKQLGLVEKLFDRFSDYLNRAGFDARQGQIVDATIVRVPIRRDNDEINGKVKNGEEVAEWKPASRAQKDTTARWTQKNGKSSFGYKNHISGDVKHKLIRKYKVTPASIHDTNEFESLLSPNSDPSVYADSAYHSQERVSSMLKPDSPWLPFLNEKGCRKRTLTEDERRANHQRSKIRARIEHVFGAQHRRAGNTLLRCIGIARATVKIGLRNIAYNISRHAILAPALGGIVS